MDLTYKFKSGKYVGKTVAWVLEHEPTYIDWVKRERPQMLKIKETTVKKLEDTLKGIAPNYNFYNEGPDPISMPYLKKMAEQKAASGETKSFFDLDI